MAERLHSQDGLLSSGPTVAPSETASLSICLFGSFAAQIEGVPLPRLRSRRGQWLLALLVLRAGRPVERSWLAGTLWPDSTEENALISLRQTLTDLRHALGAESRRLISPTSRTLCLDFAGAFVDIAAYDAALKRGDRPSLEQAVRLHQKPLLEDCHEEWVLPEREHRAQAYLTALQGLAALAMTAGRPGEAVGHLQRLVSVDPFREDARRDLMTAFAQMGNPGDAVWVYRDLRLLLQRELRTDPAPETRVLYEQIRRETRRPTDPPAETSEPVPATRAASRAAASNGSSGVLPKPLTDLIGRERDVEEVGVRLFRSRLVTLQGMGGVGKTRLAIQVAEVWAEDQPEGVAFVDLAPVADAALTARAVANALGLSEEPGQPLAATLGEALCERRLLLVLDNCEHLLEACAFLAAHLLSECPALVILTTSRQPLGVMGEIVWVVNPLALPSPPEKDSVEAISGSSAVRLFVDRASSVRAGFCCTPANAAALTEICIRLDGVPLALELAAARVKMLTPEQIRDRLDDRFRLLSQGSRTALPRQQTLRALLDWSYGLLSETERRLLGRCAVFSGGWTIETAEAVCAADAEEAAGVLDALTGLVDKSLVQVTSDEGAERRYRLLETVRQYARESLDDAVEKDALCRRHRDWSLALAAQAQAHVRGAQKLLWLDRLEAEHGNLRAALEFCRNDADGGAAYLTLAADLWRLWMERGYFAEGREHLTAALTRGAAADVGVRIKALNGAAAMAWHQGDMKAARVWMEEGLGLARETESLPYLESCLHNLGNVVYSQGDLKTARPLWEEGLAIRRQIGNHDGVSSSLNNLGCLAYDEGDLARAEALHEEALTLVSGFENRHQRRAALVGLGNIRELEGDHGEARAFYEEALSLARELDDKECLSGCLTGLGKVALRSGETARAASLFREALVIARDTGMKPAMLGALECFAEFHLTRGELPQAVRLWAVVETQRDALGLPMLPPDRVRHDEGVAFAQNTLGPEMFLSAWNEGRSLQLDQAVALALEQPLASPTARAADAIFHFSATDTA